MMIAYLEKVEPKQRMLRFYALRVAPTLFGEWTLVREWGRIGSGGTVREDWFGTEEEAQVAMVELALQKQRRGYR